MRSTKRSDQLEARQRRLAVQLYRAGQAVKSIVQKLKRSRSWVYKWIQYHRHHPGTRFRSGSRAPHHPPHQTPRVVERRVLRLRQHLVQHATPDTRFAGTGARTIQSEYRKRYGPPPGLSTLQRILKRNHCTTPPPRTRKRYRSHPPAEYPNAVQATDIITRWITGGTVVQAYLPNKSGKTRTPSTRLLTDVVRLAVQSGQPARAPCSRRTHGREYTHRNSPRASWS